MRVLQINCVYKNGSTGRIAYQIKQHLDSKGIENYVAHGIPRINERDTYVINNKVDAHLHSFLSRKLCLQGKASIIVTCQLINYIKSIKPDIIHLHNLHGHYLNYEILFRYLKASGLPVLWTFHDCWAMTGKCAHFTRANCYKWESEIGCCDCPQLYTYPDSKRDRSKKNFADKKKAFCSVDNLTIATVSEWLKGICERSFLKEKKIVCIPNGIDTNVFKPQGADIYSKYSIPHKKIILGVASVWNHQKGEESFIKIAETLPEDFVVVLVGKGSEEVKDNCKKIIAVPRTSDQKELAAIYSMSFVSLCMSIEESCPLVVSESMACGTPVICYNSTAVPELVHPGLGFIVEPGNVERVCQLICQMANGNDDYREKCRSHVIEHHSVEYMTEAYYQMYCKLCGVS